MEVDNHGVAVAADHVPVHVPRRPPGRVDAVGLVLRIMFRALKAMVLSAATSLRCSGAGTRAQTRYTWPWTRATISCAARSTFTLSVAGIGYRRSAPFCSPTVRKIGNAGRRGGRHDRTARPSCQDSRPIGETRGRLGGTSGTRVGLAADASNLVAFFVHVPYPIFGSAAPASVVKNQSARLATACSGVASRPAAHRGSPGARRAARSTPLHSSSTSNPIFSQKIREYRNV